MSPGTTIGDINVEAGATVTLSGANTFGPGSGLLISGGGTGSNTGVLTANPTLSDSTLINTGIIIGAVYGIHSPNTLINTGTITNSSSTIAGGEAVSFALGGYVENGIVPGASNYGATLAGYDSAWASRARPAR